MYSMARYWYLIAPVSWWATSLIVSGNKDIPNTLVATDRHAGALQYTNAIAKANN
uniref:Uncharacterized protein n=1 Tax=Aspergillus fumigatus TaxID=746128 RepID=Q6MY83_ASPFM|nr:hypothetical protein AfA33H4.050 [Aspergillus fumigatus]